MLEGTYAVSARTPLGLKRGSIRFSRAADGRIAATLDVRGVRCAIDSVAVDGEAGAFRLSGTLRHLLGSVAFTAAGRVEGDRLTARGESPAGTITITGSRAA